MGESYGLVCIYLALLIFFAGRIIGKRLDKEYREPEGCHSMVTIPPQWKWLFSFHRSSGDTVVRAGVIMQIVGYVFTCLELLCFIGTILEHGRNALYSLAWGVLVLFFAVIVFAVLLPFSFCYNRNIQKALDCDWITQLQEAFTILPKRRCRIIQVIDEKTCIIKLRGMGRRTYYARATFPVKSGEKMYALHSNEKGHPFWTLREH